MGDLASEVVESVYPGAVSPKTIGLSLPTEEESKPRKLVQRSVFTPKSMGNLEVTR